MDIKTTETNHRRISIKSMRDEILSYINSIASDAHSDADKEYYANCVTSICITMWLEHDKNLHMTIREYTYKEEKNEDEQNGSLYPDYIRRCEARCAAMERSRDIMERLVSIHNDFAKKLNIGFSRLSYAKNAKKKYDPIFLQSCEQKMNHTYDLIDLFFRRTKYLSLSTDGKIYKNPTSDADQTFDNINVKNQTYYSSIYKAYQNLTTGLYRITKITENKKYVIACAEALKSEIFYRFILVSDLAKYLKDNNIPITNLPMSLIPFVVRNLYSISVFDLKFIFIQNFHDEVIAEIIRLCLVVNDVSCKIIKNIESIDPPIIKKLILQYMYYGSLSYEYIMTLCPKLRYESVPFLISAVDYVLRRNIQQPFLQTLRKSGYDLPKESDINDFYILQSGIRLSYFATKYTDFFEQAFSMTSDSEDNNTFCLKINDAREITEKAYSHYCKRYKYKIVDSDGKSFQHWCDKDFKDAAEFYKNTFGINEHLKRLNWVEYSKDLDMEYVYQLYQMDLLCDRRLLNVCRGKLSKSVKRKNFKHPIKN